MCVSAGVTKGPVITHILSLSVTTTPKHITPLEMRQFQKTGIQVGLVYALKIKHAIHVKGELHLDMSASTPLKPCLPPKFCTLARDQKPDYR